MESILPAAIDSQVSGGVRVGNIGRGALPVTPASHLEVAFLRACHRIEFYPCVYRETESEPKRMVVGSGSADFARLDPPCWGRRIIVRADFHAIEVVCEGFCDRCGGRGGGLGMR